MKLAWASPFVRQSAIGRVSATAVNALVARGHQVDAIRIERDISPGDTLHDLDAPVRAWHSLRAQDLARYDLVIVNVGDNFLFHAGALALLRDAPCLGIFHDFYLFNLFNGWVVDQALDCAAAADEIVHAYGDSARLLAERALRGEASLEEIAANIPMTEWLGRKCAGALVHAQFYQPRLDRACAGPVATSALPWNARTPLLPPQRDEASLTIVTLGVVNPNKCVDAVIEAIAASPGLSTRVAYRVVGPITEQERTRLEALAAESGFLGLTLLGAVDDATLEQEIEGADILSCLRRPVLEGASASAIEGMLSARPIIVADTGFYAGLPDDLVVKIPAAVEQVDLTRALGMLAEDAALRRDMGVRAAAWAQEAFAIERYVIAVEALARETIAAIPRLSTAGRVGGDLAALGLGEDDQIIAAVASKLDAMFAPRS
jgi:glycosyltransferase involved in cell wall biosynthesis